MIQIGGLWSKGAIVTIWRSKPYAHTGWVSMIAKKAAKYPAGTYEYADMVITVRTP